MRYIKLLIFSLSVSFIIEGCTENFEELNTNPLALTEDKVDASLIGLAFAQTQYNTVNGLNWRFQISQNLFSDIYCQYYATTQSNFDSDRYTQVGRWADLAWSSFYGEAAPNIKFVEDFTGNNGLDLQNAVAKVWKVYGYHRITDYWGPVPFSSFGNGEIVVPYDSQENIYRSFFPILDEAVAVLKANSGGNAFGNNDQIYSGDVDKWLVFANTLRLRLALRVKYVDAALAKTEAEKAVTDGVMESTDQSATMLTTNNSQNPLNTITNWGEFRMSAAMESVLKGYEDPRMPVYFSPAVDGDTDGDGVPYEGLRNGQSKVDLTAGKNSNHSDVGPQFLPAALGDNNRIVVIRAAEAFFLRAEGALEGWNMGGTAKELYENGIRMSMKEWTAADDAAIDGYIASTNTPAEVGDENNTPALTDIPIAYDAGGSMEKQLEQIITQKWLALYPDGWEGWAELRRTGYPKQFARLNSDNPDVAPDQIMRRMVYVTSEFNTNFEAVEAAQGLPELSSKGGDKGSTKVWWDAK